MELTGRVLYVNPKKTPSSDKPDFQTIDFGIIKEDEINFEVVEKPFAFQAVGTERIKMVEALNIGDEVKISFGIRGARAKTAKADAVATPKNPNKESIFMGLDCIRVEVIKAAEAGSLGVGNTPQPIPQPTGVTPPMGTNQLPQVWNTTKGIWEDDIPF